MEQVTIHLTGSAEEVREALLILSGGKMVPEPRQLPTSAEVMPQKEPISGQAVHRGPYSATLCARDGCHNKLTVKQVRQGSKYCSMSCAGMARRGVSRAKPAPAEVTIVAGEGITKGTALSPETPPRLPVPS